MIKIENSEVFGWEAAIRGMRNPMNSWNKSDSATCGHNLLDCENYVNCHMAYCLGQNDLKLMKNLSKAGTDHSKFLRMINVTCDITAPLYWWKEFDTYKVGTVRNSCSTMHKIHEKEFMLDDFSHDQLDESNVYFMRCVINRLNAMRNLYLETKDKIYWWQIIQLLPSSYNQRATVQMNYQVLKNPYKSRKGHRLDEWQTFREWCETLPHFVEICGE